MNIRVHMFRLGGVCRRRDLLELATRAEVDAALGSGEIVRDGHGRYALPIADEAVRAANSMTGVVSHRTAALLHGWELKIPPDKPDITVPKNRKIDPSRKTKVALHRGDLRWDHVDGWRTSREKTLVDCLRTLPFDEALAVADSALRHHHVTKERLITIAGQVRGPGAPQCRRVARAANGRAANPFESALRSVTLEVPGLRMVPQLPVAVGELVLHPDLVDERRRLVVEADSFSWHGDRRALRRDCRRYNLLVVHGWTVLRFAWEDVMHDPDHVRRTLSMAVSAVTRRTEVDVQVPIEA